MNENSSELGNDSQANESAAVEHLLEEFVQQHRAGKSPSVEDLIASHPQLEKQIRDLMPAVLMMEQMRAKKIARRSDGMIASGPTRVEQLGDFKIVREIGRGGMGIVYEAVQESLGRSVALKLLPNTITNEKQLADFRREANIAAQLHHTNIVPIYGVGNHENTNFYAMQLIDGKGLETFVKQTASDQKAGRQIDAVQLAQIGLQISSALEHAHQQGVLHRDIKPSNLLLDTNRKAWIADFGLATAANDSTEATSKSRGTLRYLPPENFKGNYDARSEIYSLGVTLLDVFHGQSIFGDCDSATLANRILNAQKPGLNQSNRRMPADLQYVLTKAIAVDPADRFRTVGEFQTDLNNFLEKRPLDCRPTSSIAKLYLWTQRRKALATMTVASFAFLMAFAAATGVGYFKVRSALQAEHKQKLRAEKNGQLATETINRIFAQFAPDSEFMADNATEETLVQPMLSKETASLLQQLLHYYNQLGMDVSGPVEITEKTAMAQCAVGEIHELLNENEKAIEAFERADALYRMISGDQNRFSVQYAQIQNRIGAIRLTQGDNKLSANHHLQAIEILKTVASSETGVQIELARSHFHLGRRVRPGMDLNSLPPPESALSDFSFGSPLARGANKNPKRRRRSRPPRHGHRPPHPSRSGNQDIGQLKTAIEILEREIEKSLGKQREIAEMEFLLSCCYVELSDALHRSDEVAANDNREKSQKILNRLVELYPNRTAYRFQLMQSLAEINVFARRIRPEQLNDARQRLEKALEQGRVLIESRPDVPKYQIGLNHLNFKLATVLQRMGKHERDSKNPDRAKVLFGNSKIYFENATNGQRTIVEKHEIDSYRAWLGRMLLNFSASGCELSRSERLHLIDTAIAEIEIVKRSKKNIDAMLDEARRLRERLSGTSSQD